MHPPSKRVLLLPTSRSTELSPSSYLSRPSTISTNLASGLRTREKALMTESENESMIELCESGGGCEMKWFFATAWMSSVSPDRIALHIHLPIRLK